MRPHLSYANIAATLALAVAVAGVTPAVADPIASGAQSAVAGVKRALKLGKQANKRSRTAIRTARRADGRARDAVRTAARAQSAADAALAAAEGAGMDAAEALAGVADTYSKAESDSRYLAADATAADAARLGGADPAAYARSGAHASAGNRLYDSTTYDCNPAPGPPTVTVTVGDSGLVALYAEARLSAGSTDPAREARLQVDSPTAAFAGCLTVARSTAATATLVRSTPGDEDGTTGAGGWVLIRAEPGEHTFKLSFGHTGNGFGGLALLSDSYLHVVPL